MPRYDKSSAKELKEFLYNGCIHDAKIENVSYDCSDHLLRIEAVNTFFNAIISFIFYDVEMALAIRGHDFGNCETIISLTVEDDLTCLQNYVQTCSESITDSLYMLFQTFSGDELHIVAKEVLISQMP